MTQEGKSRRWLTAITRGSLSVPARQALLDRQILLDDAVFDYGCGRGEDVRALRHLGCEATGWDPFYERDVQLKPASVVLLTYVLNVIEDPVERRHTLQSAWNLAGKVLIASARLSWERSKVNGQEFGDGLLTRRKTFQHLYGANELRTYVEEITGVRAVSAAPGIIYAFKTDSDRLSYLARRIVADDEWLASSDTATAVAALIDHVERRGRPPRLEEVPRLTAQLLAHLSPVEVRRLVRESADSAKVSEGARRTTLNTLLFLAVELFNGRGPFTSLPLTVQLDIRAFFSSYKEACRRADRLLLKLRDDAYVRGAMSASNVGKLTPTALYVHRRAVDRMPTVLRLYEHCASIAAGRPQAWTVVKLCHRGRAVSWLDYPEFDRDPHPRLLTSYQVNLETFETSHQSYAGRSNRPLLHRKHEFLYPDDPEAPKYRRLTEAEVKAGLYAYPHLIGTEAGWERELARCQRALRGHRLVRTRD
ncbi:MULTISPECIES: DNA phosphorothioation-associated putative methyltransferase [Streptomyces]|uniref:DNA phosphorothioation-associated putative methyltransferase n=1 Tax=Streptomyces TaxID=1883 RepID=UPI000E079CDA|nr:MULTISPECIES: DNA phosphorothioation-associated putative methyltransferase [Streptomyces]MBT3077304.1 DNA phosphorothioation-associated putative methyltransferase [Streptomyces sp. COG21]MBT3082622.1 DNA phosphorothioation-associated putative methyltransferase [Streptomyces sp. COG20]MBT3087442.1 DNA phosphorothioation-associated putative methyltransferase [Streptomyces sp. CYG21]MBT3097527.1 DNA phosphorothioation-associated putative methyltransferase [Streptomyces sp. CBG30]MBT3104598.1 D